MSEIRRIEIQPKTEFLSRDDFMRLVNTSSVDSFNFFYTDSAVNKGKKSKGTIHVDHFTKISKRDVHSMSMDDLIRNVSESKILVTLKVQKPARESRGIL